MNKTDLNISVHSAFKPYINITQVTSHKHNTILFDLIKSFIIKKQINLIKIYINNEIIKIKFNYNYLEISANNIIKLNTIKDVTIIKLFNKLNDKYIKKYINIDDSINLFIFYLQYYKQKKIYFT